MVETKLSDLDGLKKKEMDYLMDYTMSGGGLSVYFSTIYSIKNHLKTIN